MVKILSFLFILTCSLSQGYCSKNISTSPPRVAITQITSHPSLDLIRQGLTDYLTENTPDIEILYKNPQGRLDIAASIAHSFASLNPPGILVAITTPSAQSMAKAVSGKNIPLVFAAVTDPVGAKLLKDVSKPYKTITGTIDQPPVDHIVEVMQTITPALKTIGVLYNPGEANSKFQVAVFKAAAQTKGLTIHEVPITKLADIPLAVPSLASKKVEAVFVPNDNLVVSGLDSLLKSLQKSKIPLYVSDPQSVQRGAFAALAFDQYEIGRQTGVLVLKLVQGTPLESIPPVRLQNPKFYVNSEVAKALGISSQVLEKLQNRFKDPKAGFENVYP